MFNIDIDIDIDIDDANFGKWMNAGKHRSGAKAYNKLWERALDANMVTEKNALRYAKKFMKEI